MEEEQDINNVKDEASELCNVAVLANEEENKPRNVAELDQV